MILMYEKCNISVALWLFTDSKECSLKFTGNLLAGLITANLDSAVKEFAGVESFAYYFNVNVQDSIYIF